MIGTFELSSTCYPDIHQVETTLGPMDLLNTLQDIEIYLGRHKVVDKGPRNIDLDILLYDNTTIDHERLKVPHAAMLEREFVLRPLAEYVYIIYVVLVVELVLNFSSQTYSSRAFESSCSLEDNSGLLK